MVLEAKKKIKVCTCEGDIVEFDYIGQKYTSIPLNKVKAYIWDEVLEKEIPINFQEKFEHEVSYYVGDAEALDKGEHLTFDRWSSKEIL